MEARESFGRRVGRFTLLLGLVFALTLAVVIGQRLSADALALLVGLGVGMVAMSPLAGLVVFLWRREERQRTTQLASDRAYPSVVVVSPPMLPNYGMQRSIWDERNPNVVWNPASTDRKFTVVGGEE
jgi:hypothetical protein